MDALMGKWERTSAENYEELLKVRLLLFNVEQLVLKKGFYF